MQIAVGPDETGHLLSDGTTFSERVPLAYDPHLHRQSLELPKGNTT